LRKKLLSGLVFFGVLASLLAVSMVFARGPHGQAGKSNIAHLYLYEKDPSTWEIVEDGAWGKMKYNLAGSEFEFVFNGHGLQSDTEYALIYYVDQENPFVNWGKIGAVISTGISNKGGNIHLAGSVDIGSIPYEEDLNFGDGAKIWLILSSDYSGLQMTGWHPTEYLFEHNLITFGDTDVP